MYKNSFYSLLIVLVIPLIGYLLLYVTTHQTIKMPPKHFVDTVVTKIEKGKTIYDTIFHQINNKYVVTHYKSSISFDLRDMWHRRVSLLYIAHNIDSFTYKNLAQLSRLKTQFKIDSFLNIICFVSTYLPDSFLLPNINFLKFEDSLQQKKFFNQELKLNIHTQMFPWITLVDKQNIVRNYYLLNAMNEEQLLLDVILINLEKE